nr:hypothetical protein [uncultured Rhodopila sp.]
MTGATMTHELASADDLREDTKPGLVPDVAPVGALSWRSALRSWLVQDSPYIAMLALALAGVTFHLPAGYWAVLTPVFGGICVAAGWRHFATPEGRLQLAYTQALSWLALIFTVYILFNTVVQNVLNTSATSLAMMTLLALGTFTAGLQSRVWRICAVGAIMLVAVPAMGWLEQSALLVTVAVLAIAAAGFATWWVGQRGHASV